MKVFDCQHCQQPFQVGPEHAGMAVACPACGQANRIAQDAFVSKPQTSQVFACPSCEGKFQVPLAMDHRTVACPHCQKPVAIPSSQSSGESSRAQEDQPVEVPSIKPKPLKSRKKVRKAKAKRRGTQPFVPPSDDLFAPGFNDDKTGDKVNPSSDAPSTSAKSEVVPPITGSEKKARQGDGKNAGLKGQQSPPKSIDRPNDRLATPPTPKPKSKPKPDGAAKAKQNIAPPTSDQTKPTDQTKTTEQAKPTSRERTKLPPVPEPAKNKPRGPENDGKRQSKPKSSAPQTSTARTSETKDRADEKVKANSKNTSDLKARPKSKPPQPSKTSGEKEPGASSRENSKKGDRTQDSTKPVPGSTVDKVGSERVIEASVVPSSEKIGNKDAGKPSKPADSPAEGTGKADSANEDFSSQVEAAFATAPATTDTLEPPEFGKKPIDHLLPPKFDVIDPQRLSISLARDDNKVFLPGSDGGTVRVDKRIVHVQHGQDKVSLVVLSPEQRERRRLIQNSIVILIGMLLIAATLWMLLN